MLAALLLWLAAPCLALRQDLLNTCLDAKHHKRLPGPEDALHSQCSPWRARSCCTAETTHALHHNQLSYSFDYDHCRAVRPMSERCRQHFTQDHCFYECSPNLGPWTVKEAGRAWRRERFHGAPLCRADCHAWFAACRDDLTCTHNWARNFEWRSVAHGPGADGKGMNCPRNASQCVTNVCPRGAACRTFADVFNTAENFCMSVWDGSWAVQDDASPCMRLWFDGAAGNPNDAVARLYVSGAAGRGPVPALCLAAALLLLCSCCF